jgi:RND family efflux transporter MFP subunit
MTDTNQPSSPDNPKPVPAERRNDRPSELPEARVVSESAGHVDHEPMHEGEEEVPRGVRVMTIVRWGLVILMALAAGAGLNHRFGWFSLGRSGAGVSETTYYCSMHPNIKQDHPGDCPICSMTLVSMPKAGDGKAEQAAMEAMGSGAHDHAMGSGTYYCPMHPEVTSDDPNATCEKCGGMKLEPRPAAAVTPPQDAEGVKGLVPLTLSQDRIQLMGMRTAKVMRGTLAPELRTVGTVVATENGLAVIQTRFAGWIEDLKVQQTGQKVERGQVLATIYSPELLTAQQEYLNARKWAQQGSGGRVSDLSLDLHKDARRRLELLGIAANEIDAIERSGESMRAIAIRSPVRGYVIQKNAIQGVTVQPGMALFQIADLSTVWVLADVYEYELGRVKIGQAASIELAAYPGERFTGKVTFMDPAVNSNTRTLRVRLELKNPALRLKPGMYGTVNIQLERAESLLMPVDAIVDTGVVQYVFVTQPGGKFEPRKVKLGARSGGSVQIAQGLAEGETVVTTANFLLDSESHLQATILGDGASGGAPAPPGDFCEASFDKAKFPDKYQQCAACRAHRGMGSMEDDCRAQIAKPWK